MKRAKPTLMRGSMPAPSWIVGPLERPLVWTADGPVHVRTFLQDVHSVLGQLPPHRYVMNLCEDRYRFLVGFYACALRGQTTLLPSSRAQAVLEQARQCYPDSYTLNETDAVFTRLMSSPASDSLPVLDVPISPLDDQAIVAVGFTSGSTGAPTAHAKTWGNLRVCATLDHQILQQLWQGPGTPTVIATVPAQHMYGMELSVLLPVVSAMAVHTARPFFPEDIAKVLAQVPEPRILVTTPLHLQVLVESHSALPTIAGIVTATAPLSCALAQAAQKRFSTQLLELFGSTETLVCAWRNPVNETAWTPLPGVRIQPKNATTQVYRDHLAEPLALADHVEQQADGRFQLCGRAADMVEVAGKRASLANLNRHLLAIPGVEDGVLIQLPASPTERVSRIVAAIVAPTLDETAILKALRVHVDPVFLPRRLRFVTDIPRNAVGKIEHHVIMELVAHPPLPCTDRR